MNKKIIIFLTLIFSLMSLHFFIRESHIEASLTDPFFETSKRLPLPTYQTVTFRFDKIPWLTAQQLSEHMELYKGYVTKRNEITKTLNTMNNPTASTVYSEYRSLKAAETFAMNGDILHRLYFENISDKKSNKPGDQMLSLITDAFGTLDAFKSDLFACAASSRGWVLTCYSLDDNRIHNFLLDAHNQTVPILVIPLLVFDVYEHAYFIDFGTKRSFYIERFWYNINWDVIENRITQWVKPLMQVTTSK